MKSDIADTAISNLLELSDLDTQVEESNGMKVVVECIVVLQN